MRSTNRHVGGHYAPVPLDKYAQIWDLPIGGFELLEVTFSAALHLVAYGDRGGVTQGLFPPTTAVMFPGPFSLRSADRSVHQLDGEGPWQALVPVLALRHVRIASATADRQGNLAVTFDDGSALAANPDEHYENWTVHGPDGLDLAAAPSGGINGGGIIETF